MAIINPSYEKRTLYHLEHATADNQLTALWPGIVLSHPWFTRQQLQQRTAGQPKLTWDLLRTLSKQDSRTIDYRFETRTRDSVRN